MKIVHYIEKENSKIVDISLTTAMNTLKEGINIAANIVITELKTKKSESRKLCFCDFLLNEVTFGDIITFLKNLSAAFSHFGLI